MKPNITPANRFVLDPKESLELRATLKNDPKAGLKMAAREFESMMLQMLLKSMRETTAQDGFMDSDQTRFYTGIFDQQLSMNLSATGGLGFAKKIEEQLGRNLAGGQTITPERAESLEILRQSLLQGGFSGSPIGAGGILPTRSAQAAEINTPPIAETKSQQEFVNRIWPHAVEAAKSLGVPPHFVVAHAALESGWGRSEIRAENSAQGFNLFGIKAGKSWQGASTRVQTTEYINGEMQSMQDRFRVYSSYAEAFSDYANLLKSNPRFSGVLGQRDGEGFARALQQGGYATDPAYAGKLGRIINGSSLRQALSG